METIGEAAESRFTSPVRNGEFEVHASAGSP